VFDVTTSIPNARSSSTMRWINGTQAFRTVLKMW
jgi:hypothetical protein